VGHQICGVLGFYESCFKSWANAFASASKPIFDPCVTPRTSTCQCRYCNGTTEFAAVLSKHHNLGGDSQVPSILLPGCGNSLMGFQLHQAGYKHVTQVDCVKASADTCRLWGTLVNSKFNNGVTKNNIWKVNYRSGMSISVLLRVARLTSPTKLSALWFRSNDCVNAYHPITACRKP